MSQLHIIHLRTTAALVLATLVAACGPSTPHHTDGLRSYRDSAGISIVENHMGGQQHTELWHIESEPLITIGVLDGPQEYQFFRVAGALRQHDGTMVVADMGSRQIRFFDSSGAHLRSVGGPGEGPGEYRSLRFLRRFALDSLLVYDAALRRGTILASDGGFGRTFTFEADHSLMHVIDAFDDGTLLAMIQDGIDPQDRAGEIVDNVVLLVRYLEPGSYDTLGRFFRNQAYVTNEATLIPMPFARVAVHATAGDLIHYGDAQRHEIRTYSSTGDLVRIVRTDQRNTLLRDSDVAALLASTSNARRRQDYAEIPFPETLPAYSELMIDVGGNLWVGDYLRQFDEERTWTIIDPHGSVIAKATTPARIDIHEIGDDYILGVVHDALDVERLMMFKLVKLEAS